MLIYHGLAYNTRKQIPAAFATFTNFCEWAQIDPFTPSAITLSDFISWAYESTSKSSTVVNQWLTKIVQVWTDNGATFKRINYPFLGRQMKGFRSLRPGKKVPKIPIVWELFVPICDTIDLSKKDGWFYLALLSMGYFFGARPGEYTYDKSKAISGAHLLLVEDFTFSPSFQHPSALTIDFTKSKADQFGDWNQYVTRSCSCQQHKYCPVHIFTKYFLHRINQFGPVALTQPALINANATIANWTHVRNVLYKACDLLNLPPRHILPHGLRAGGATDLARKQWTSLQVEQWGRWKSNCWKQFYVKLNFLLLAKLTGLSVVHFTNKILFNY